MDLSPKDIEKAKFTFSVYDFDGQNCMDAVNLGPALRALGLTPTLAFIGQLGGTRIKGEKSLKVEEFLAIYVDAKKNKDVGTMEDFMECLRSNDKEGDGNISSDQLSHLLQAYGERLDPDEIAEVFHDCATLQDGFLSYASFLKNLMDDPDNMGDNGSFGVSSIQDQLTTNDSEVKSTSKSNAKTGESNVSKPKLEDTTSNDALMALKTTKSKSSNEIVDEDKNRKAEKAAAAIQELKPKKQQALIALKTMAMIENMK